MSTQNDNRPVWWLALSGMLAAVPFLPAQSVSALQIVTDTLPNASTGVSYSQQLVVIGGSCPGPGAATFALDAGAFPPGISVTSPVGLKLWTVQGTPTAAGTFPFTLHVKWTHARSTPFDQACVDEGVKALSLTVQGSGGGGGGGGGGGSQQLTVDRTQVSSTYHTDHFPQAPEMVQVTAAGNAATPFTTQAVTTSGLNWLSVTPSTGMTPAALAITFSINGLAPGVYAGTVTVQGGANQASIAVTLTVLTNTTLLLASPTAFNFSYVTGGQTPPAQTLSVTAAGDAVIFRAIASMNGQPATPWLLVTPSSAATSAQLAVSVNPKNLTPGTYNGSIAVFFADQTSSAQRIPVAFLVQAPPAQPTVSQNGVVSAASLGGAIAPGAWVSIFGAKLSATTRLWTGADFVAGKLPLTIDGVSVTINGKAAAVEFVSPTQINVLAPDDTATGLVSVQVTAPAGTSNSALVLEQTIAPALFQLPAGATVYVAGTHADGSYLAGPGLVQTGILGTPARPGETVVVYGTGFGATQPPISATAMVPAPLPLANQQDLHVRIGGMDANILFAGLVTPGLYQFNVVVPQVADGDQSIVVELRGLLSRADLMLPVQH